MADTTSVVQALDTAFEAAGDGGQPSPAFVAGVLKQLGALQLYARNLERGRAAADDLVQETVERALRGAHRFHQGSNLRAWLMRIMCNLFKDGCRRAALTRKVGNRLASEPTPA